MVCNPYTRKYYHTHIIFAYIRTFLQTHTVGENIKGAPEMRNNFATIQLYNFQYCDSNIGFIAP